MLQQGERLSRLWRYVGGCPGRGMTTSAFPQFKWPLRRG
jgi:hypothetical protein